MTETDKSQEHNAANEDGPTVDEFLDGWALWQEHRPQTAEDWVRVAKRCAADPTFEVAHARPPFGAAVLLARELMDRG